MPRSPVAQTTGWEPSRSPSCWKAYTTVPSPTADIPALTASHRSGRAWRDSGTSRAQPTTASTTIGTLTRNTAPHRKCSISSPPRSGPTDTPTLFAAVHRPIATDRSRSSGNTALMRAGVLAMIIAPPTPSADRAAINCPGVTDSAAPADASPNTTNPAISIRLRPNRSPSVPKAISPAATVSA